jgi:hypothetical protein
MTLKRPEEFDTSLRTYLTWTCATSGTVQDPVRCQRGRDGAAAPAARQM